MNPSKINNLEEYNILIERFHKKGCTSNNYMMPNEIENLVMSEALSYISTENNIIFLVQKPKCKRGYYHINNFEEYFVFDDDDYYMVEILFRGQSFYPEKEIEYVLKCGFEINLVRDQYTSMYKDLFVNTDSTQVNIKKASSLEEVKYACELFNNTFDVFSGDFISEEEYSNLLKNDAIIIAEYGGKIVGALHQTIERTMVWLSHVAVEQNCRGMHIGKSLVDFWIEQNKKTDKTRYSLWVQRQNTPAVKMYQNKGFKYVNKSTVSLIKTKESK